MILNKFVSAGSVLRLAVLYILTLLAPLQAHATAELSSGALDTAFATKASYAESQLNAALVVGIGSETRVSNGAGETFAAAQSGVEMSWLAGILLSFVFVLALFNSRRGRSRKRSNASVGHLAGRPI